MKIIIKENERGYLFKDGIFIKLLNPGKHSYIWGNYEIKKVNVDSMKEISTSDMDIFLKDENFKKSVVKIDIPDGKLAVHYVNGRKLNVLVSGEYAYWNIIKKHTFELIDISKPEVQESIDRSLFKYMPISLYTKIEVAEGQRAVVYFDGKFHKELSSGVYYFWNSCVKVTYKLVDIRVQKLEVLGQEILTTDRVSLRINFVCDFRVVDAVSITSKIKDYATQLYTFSQMVIREYIGRFKFDDILNQKEEIGGFILSRLKEKEREYYVEFIGAGIKDIILPGEVRDIMNTVLIAEKKAQANVISRREEVASTRSLLNTAKLLDENETLYKLKEMEYLERICDKVGSISLSGGNNLLGQLNELLCQK
ncbi:peptidase [Clostridium acetobutylicum]|nr:peptidase [Clostridium acetobutylicum]